MALQRPTRTIEIELPGGITRPFTIYDNELSMQVTAECLSGWAYPTPPQLKAEDVRTIVDVGANIGAASIWFHSRFPNATIHAYEPCRQSHNLMVENTADLNVLCHPFGLGLLARNAILFLDEQDAVKDSLIQPQRYFPSQKDAEKYESVTIDDAASALDKLLPIDILKIDTEGSEVEILRSLTEHRVHLGGENGGDSFLSAIAVIHIEYHSEHDRREIDQIIADHHGFTLFHASANYPHRGLLGYLRNDLLTQKDNDHAIG